MKKVRIILKDNSSLEGVLIDRPTTFNKDFITLKLSNGYNIGISKENIKKIEELGIIKQKKVVKTSKHEKSDKPLLMVLHTGGTIASSVDYSTGGVISNVSPEFLIERIPEIKDFFSVETRMITNILSENIRFEHYNLFIDEIVKAIKKGAKAIIMSHGTDTLHYTAIALHYALDLPIPVVLVGSQKSSDRPSTDAWTNLKGAILFLNEAIKKNMAGVFIAMHRDTSDNFISILPFRSRKMHTSRRDAFKPINSEEVAVVDIINNSVVIHNPSLYPSKPLAFFRFDPSLRVGIVKAHPNMFKEELEAFKGFDGLILEGTGLGHFPILSDEVSKKNEEIFNVLKELSKSMPIYMTSQCIYGRINMNVYAPGRLLKEIGVKGNLSDYTTEEAFILLSLELSKKKK